MGAKYENLKKGWDLFGDLSDSCDSDNDAVEMTTGGDSNDDDNDNDNDTTNNILLLEDALYA